MKRKIDCVSNFNYKRRLPALGFRHVQSNGRISNFNNGNKTNNKVHDIDKICNDNNSTNVQTDDKYSTICMLDSDSSDDLNVRSVKSKKNYKNLPLGGNCGKDKDVHGDSVRTVSSKMGKLRKMFDEDRRLKSRGKNECGEPLLVVVRSGNPGKKKDWDRVALLDNGDMKEELENGWRMETGWK
ncbi:uncharacterized protein LOC124441536 [Xenia sp. Carnegie-2017]|uniref:uncharacterized protein LOC124441536 n=1 Tax=Xenia sp. Carnegie-2017 TaxID=2897299 RepID=UPI001F04C018|nr:uncharacterized protein LOC124441536 [Xenia sp. Carnegie-2017]